MTQGDRARFGQRDWPHQWVWPKRQWRNQGHCGSASALAGHKPGQQSHLAASNLANAASALSQSAGPDHARWLGLLMPPNGQS